MNKNLIFTAVVLLTLLFSVATAIPFQVKAQSTEPLFKITIIAPGLANLLRQQWGLIIANSFSSVGIDARVVFIDWTGVIDRVFEPPAATMGLPYDEGGFDAELIGWTPGNPGTPFADTFSTYHSSMLPPGSNYFLWDNATADLDMETWMKEGYTATGIQAFKDWQLVQFDDLPASQIYLSSVVVPASTDINFNNWEWIFDNIETVPEQLTGVGGADISEVVLATTGQLKDVLPYLSNSWYDTLAFSPAMDQFFNINTTYGYPVDLSICTSYNVSVSPTMREYTFNLRSGVEFHDNHVVDADDVVYSYWAAMYHPASYDAADYLGVIGDDISFTWLNGTTKRLVYDPVAQTRVYPANATTIGTKQATIAAADMDTVVVSGANISAIYHPARTGDLDILPKHVLETIPLADWDAHTFNTGEGSYEVNGKTFYGPIGIGPYVFMGYNPATQLVTLQKFDNYWNAANVPFEVETFYVRFIAEKDAAIAALKNDEVQILGGQYQMQRDYYAGTLAFADTYVLPGSGIQQLGYNMRHPIFGTGVDTPLGQADPSRAAEAARYVRKAFDHLIPRDLIIDNLLSGVGEPAAVHVNSISPYYETSIVPREYNPQKAREYLALAGYDTGVTPTKPTALTSYLLGQPATFSGSFAIDTVASQLEGGIVVLLEMSTDNATWSPVAQGITTTGGYYSLAYAPPQTGDYYFRVALTGVGATTAAASLAMGPDTPYAGLPKTVDPQHTLSTQVTVISTADLLSDLTTDVADLTSEVSDLTAQVANLTTVAYGGIVVAIIAIIIAFLVGRRG